MPVVNASGHRNHCVSSICDSQTATKSVESPLSQSSKYHLDRLSAPLCKVPPALAAAVLDRARAMIEDAVDRMKTDAIAAA